MPAARTSPGQTGPFPHLHLGTCAPVAGILRPRRPEVTHKTAPAAACLAPARLRSYPALERPADLGSRLIMRHGRLAPLCLILLAASAPGETPLDTSYLRDHAQTRGFMLGRPARPRVAPDGKSVLFLRS